MPFSIGDHVMVTGPVLRRGERGFVVRPVDDTLQQFIVRFPDTDAICDAESLILVRPTKEPEQQHRL